MFPCSIRETLEEWKDLKKIWTTAPFSIILDSLKGKDL